MIHDDQTLGSIADWLAGQDIRIAVVFGSIARGSAGPDSDLDIAVAARQPLSSEQRSALIEGLAERTGRPVDLIDLATVGEPLMGKIVTEGIWVLGSRTEKAQLLTRHLIEQADFLPYRERILEQRRKGWIGR